MPPEHSAHISYMSSAVTLFLCRDPCKRANSFLRLAALQRMQKISLTALADRFHHIHLLSLKLIDKEGMRTLKFVRAFSCIRASATEGTVLEEHLMCLRQSCSFMLCSNLPRSCLRTSSSAAATEASCSYFMHYTMLCHHPTHARTHTMP
jgi:hypothetical protein